MSDNLPVPLNVLDRVECPQCLALGITTGAKTLLLWSNMHQVCALCGYHIAPDGLDYSTVKKIVHQGYRTENDITEPVLDRVNMLLRDK